MKYWQRRHAWDIIFGTKYTLNKHDKKDVWIWFLCVKTLHSIKFLWTRHRIFCIHKMINKTSISPEKISACTEIGIVCLIIWKSHGCPNTGRRIDRTVKSCIAAPNICGFSVWNLIYVTLLPPRNFGSLLEFLKFWHPWITPIIYLKIQDSLLLGYDTKSLGN